MTDELIQVRNKVIDTIKYHKQMRDAWQLVEQFLREELQKKGVTTDYRREDIAGSVNI